MRAKKQVPTWRVTPTDAERGTQWMLVKASEFVCKNDGDNIQEENECLMPSMAELLAKGFQASLKKIECRGFPEGANSPQMTSNHVDTSDQKPYCSDFPVSGDNTLRGQISSPMHNCNVIDSQPSAQVPVSSRKRPVFKSSFRKVEPNLSHGSKSDELQKVRPGGNSSREKCEEGAGESAVMFKTASGKSVGVSSSSLKRARVVLGEDFSSDFSHPDRAGLQQKSDELQKVRPGGNSSREKCEEGAGESAVMFKTASGKSVGVSSSSLKRARVVLGEDLSSDFSHPDRAGLQQKSDELQKVRPGGNSSREKCEEGAGESAVMFKTASGKSVGVSSSSLKRARVVLGEDLSSGFSHPDRAGLQQNDGFNKDSSKRAEEADEFAFMFKTAAGKSVGISSSSLKRARAVLGEDLRSCLDDSGRAGPQRDSGLGMFQTAAGNPLAVSNSAIKKAQAVPHEDLTSVVSELHGMPGDLTSVVSELHGMPGPHATNEMQAMFQTIEYPAIMDESITMFDAATDNSMAVPSSVSNRMSTFEITAGNPVSNSAFSITREQNVFEGDSYSRVPELNIIRPRPQTINKATAMSQMAAGNPVTVLSSSIRRAQTIFGENSTSEVLESDTKSAPEIARDPATMFQNTPGNPVSIQSFSTKKAKTMISKESSSERVDHDKFNAAVNTSSTMLQTAGGNCLNMFLGDIKRSNTNVKRDKDVQTVQNSRYLHNVHNTNSEDDLRPNSGYSQTALIFQTAAGKPVSLSRSSVKRAMSILTDDGMVGVNGDHLTSDMFHIAIENPLRACLPYNGIGDTVHEEDRTEKSEMGISKTEDGKDTHKFCMGIGDHPKFHETNIVSFESANRPAVSMHVSGEVEEESKFAALKTHSHQSLFQTGSGKPVNISMSGISRAKAMLESEGVEVCTANKAGGPSDGSASMVPVSTSDQSNFLLDKVLTVPSSGHNICSAGLLDSDSNQTRQFTFQTTAGRSVNVSTKAMRRAMDLLGDEANKGTVGIKQLDDPKINTLVCSGPPPLLFETGTGKTVCISSAAMRRAKNLLGEMNVMSGAATDSQRLNGELIESSTGSVRHCNVVSNKEKFPYLAHVFEVVSSGMKNAPSDVQRLSADFGNAPGGLSPRTPRHCQDDVSNKENLPFPSHVSGVACSGVNSAANQLPCVGTLASLGGSSVVSVDSRARKLGKRKVCISPLVEISNKSPLSNFGNHFQQPTPTPAANKMLGSKRGLLHSRYVSPFKQPRRSMFSPPFDKRHKSALMASSLPVKSIPQGAPCVTFHFSYPSHRKRKTIQDYFGGPPHHHQALWHLSSEIQAMTVDSAQHYKFHAKSGSGHENIASEDFWKMLVQSGADPRHATMEWVENHYKWIVWKLACIERSYARQALGKYLTVQNVLEELKYRYEREVNRGHRSPLKKIVEGDAAAACMMVLCVSAVRVWPTEEQNDPSLLKGPVEVSKELENGKGNDISKPCSSNQAKIELTDGWYSLNAILDKELSKQLLHGKLFVGQKLRVCGASLHGWVGPVSPFEAFQTVSLVLHINGTYRAHWAERLSFCRGLPVPLAFRCIKEGGGPVPKTLVAVTRIYPTLYGERLANGAYIVRSERAEDKTLHLYNERRTHIVEDIMLKAEKEVFPSSFDSNKDEGAQLYSVLENAAEPELIMADMTSSQLSAFAAYQSKREVSRQESIEKNIQKALHDADLDSRKVTPFMRVRIVGLTHKSKDKAKAKVDMEALSKQEGLVTIWQPTEKQVLDLEEGAIYCVSGLVPLAGKSGSNCNWNTIQFQANKSTLWHRIPQAICDNFEFVYNPRSALLLSDLGKVPLHSEFDVAVLVLHVGEPYTYGFRKRQWLFASDNSVELQGSSKQSEIILAIDFSLPCDSFIALDHSLSGFTVGFCNLVKQKRDQSNCLWVAEMTENSTHSVNFNAPKFCHLKAAADSVDQWAKVSLHAVENLSQRVYDIVRNTM